MGWREGGRGNELKVRMVDDGWQTDGLGGGRKMCEMSAWSVDELMDRLRVN